MSGRQWQVGEGQGAPWNGPLAWAVKEGRLWEPGGQEGRGLSRWREQRRGREHGRAEGTVRRGQRGARGGGCGLIKHGVLWRALGSQQRLFLGQI